MIICYRLRLGKNSCILEVYYLVEHELCVQMILGQQESPSSPQLSNNITCTLHCLELLFDNLKPTQAVPLCSLSEFKLVSLFLLHEKTYIFLVALSNMTQSTASFDLFSVNSCPLVSSSDESALQWQGSRVVNVLLTPLPPVSGATVCAINNTKLPRPLPGHLGPSRDKDL